MKDRFIFEQDELRIDEFRFRLGYDFAWDAWKSASADSFLMFKSQTLLEAFDRFFSSKLGGSPVRNIFEIGIWDGGSSAFWFEYFRPEKLVAVDWLRREDSDYFRRYVDTRGISERLKTYWGVDQGDVERLREIVDEEFASGLDLVIDDGSHMLEETRASFQTLFPRMRNGGLYILEDWNWEFNERCRAPDHPFATRDGLVELVAELVRLTGSSPVIQSMAIYKTFVVVEKGSGDHDVTLEIRELLAELPQKLHESSLSATP